MKKIFKYLKIIVITILVLIGLLSILSRLTPDGVNTVKLRNDTGQVITSAQITLQDRECSISGLQSPGYMKCYFGSMSDNSYKVSIELEDGTKIESDSIGYVTHGFDSKDLLVVNNLGKMELSFED